MRPLIVIFSILVALTRAIPFPHKSNAEPSNATPVQHQKPQSQQKQFTIQQESNQNDQAVATTQIDKDTNFVSSSSILDNPAYDANLYTSFIPQDAIQQYVNHFGGGAYSPYTASVFPPPAPFAVQTGYEGFLVPDIHGVADPIFPGPLAFLKGLIPKFFVAWLIKSATILVSTVGVVLFGAAITTAVCTLTPLCAITFSSLPFNTAGAVGRVIGSEITPDRIRRTVEFVRTAIDKFTALQNTINDDDDDKKKSIEEDQTKKL